MTRPELKFLFINPPVEDFSCSDYYSMPYGMLNCMGMFKTAGVPFYFYDFLNEGFASDGETYTYKQNGTGSYPQQIIEKPGLFSRIPRNFRRYGNSAGSFDHYLKSNGIKIENTVILLNTDFTYRADGVINFIRHLIDAYGANPRKCMLGGTAALLIPEYFQRSIPHIQVYTPDFTAEFKDATSAGRNTDLFCLDLYASLKYVPFRLGRRCPDNCAYCASGYIRKKSGRMGSSRLLDETQHRIRTYLRDYTSKFKTKTAVPLDDAFLISLKQAPLLFEDLGLTMPTPNGLHLRYINPQSAEILYGAGFNELRFGVECLSASGKRITEKKIKGVSIERKIDDLLHAGFSKSQIHFYILYGLEHQKYSDVVQTIKQLKDTGCGINVSGYSPVPHSRMFRSLDSRLGNVLSNTPAITNNNTLSLWNPEFTESRINRIKVLAK